MALSGSERAGYSTAHPASFSTDRQAIVIDSAASVIAGLRRAALTDHRVDVALETEWRPLDTLADITAEWRALAADALESNVFYDPAFAMPAASVFGRGAGAVLVWSATRLRHLLGFFPGHIERARYGFPLPVLKGWTHPYAPLGVPLVARTNAEAVIAAWLAFLARTDELPGLMLLPLVPSGPFNDLLNRLLARAAMPVTDFARHQRALLAPNGERDGYVARAIGRKRHKELRRLRRRLGELGAVSFSSSNDSAGLSASLADFHALEANGWKGRAGSAAALHPDITDFMQGAVADLAAAGQASVHCLLVGERPIAAAITLRSGDCARFWKITYDETFAPYSPGVLLTAELTEWLLADEKISRVDSCASAGHPMIDHLWRERLTLSDRLIAVRESAPFATASRLERLRRATIAAAKSTRDLLRAT